MTNKPHKKYAIIILAAGTSSRLGRPKQLVEIKGITLLSNTIKEANKVVDADTYVVLGAYANKIEKTITGEITSLENPDWKMGMGNSIALGITNIFDQGYDAVILSVSDQPFLSCSQFEHLIDVYESSPACNIVVSKYTIGSGPPTLFDSTYFDQLSRLDNDDGAKSIVIENKSSVGSADFDLGHIDIDEEIDLQNIN